MGRDGDRANTCGAATSTRGTALDAARSPKQQTDRMFMLLAHLPGSLPCRVRGGVGGEWRACANQHFAQADRSRNPALFAPADRS